MSAPLFCYCGIEINAHLAHVGAAPVVVLTSPGAPGPVSHCPGCGADLLAAYRDGRLCDLEQKNTGRAAGPTTEQTDGPA